MKKIFFKTNLVNSNNNLLFIDLLLIITILSFINF